MTERERQRERQIKRERERERDRHIEKERDRSQKRQRGNKTRERERERAGQIERGIVSHVGTVTQKSYPKKIQNFIFHGGWWKRNCSPLEKPHGTKSGSNTGWERRLRPTEDEGLSDRLQRDRSPWSNQPCPKVNPETILKKKSIILSFAEGDENTSAAPSKKARGKKSTCWK